MFRFQLSNLHDGWEQVLVTRLPVASAVQFNPDILESERS